jgi:Holliday junction resolvase RusA-like endonuclease
MPIPISKPKKWKVVALSGDIKPTGKPDASNLLKNIEDIMNGIYWKDDAQITRASVIKRYSDNPRWEIEIQEDIHIPMIEVSSR